MCWSWISRRPLSLFSLSFSRIQKRGAVPVDLVLLQDVVKDRTRPLWLARREEEDGLIFPCSSPSSSFFSPCTRGSIDRRPSAGTQRLPPGPRPSPRWGRYAPGAGLSAPQVSQEAEAGGRTKGKMEVKKRQRFRGEASTTTRKRCLCLSLFLLLLPRSLARGSLRCEVSLAGGLGTSLPVPLVRKKEAGKQPPQEAGPTTAASRERAATGSVFFFFSFLVLYFSLQGPSESRKNGTLLFELSNDLFKLSFSQRHARLPPLRRPAPQQQQQQGRGLAHGLVLREAPELDRR